MRSHVRSSLGVDTPVPATEQAPSTVEQRTPNYTQQSLALMSVAALPWLPVAAGAWVGDKYNSKGWGALIGFTFSVLVIRRINQRMAGAIS